MSGLPESRLVCAGCGAGPAQDSAFPFRCPNAERGDDVDHVLTRKLPLDRLRFPAGDSPNPFIRYRELLHSWHRARAGGMADTAFVALVERLDEAVQVMDGRGFRVTPFRRAGALGAALEFPGGVWIKDDTGNVSGSHKARHLFGVALHLAVSDALGLRPGPRPRLAIASCGNAALAAAVVARALDLELDVYVPPDAGPAVLARLHELGAAVHRCPREPGQPGDPCYLAFRAALRAGGLPFCCQGPDNGLTLEGGETLAYEIVAASRDARLALDRWFIQVGGGALGSACVQALREARELGSVASLPRIHAVQTRGAFPLRRAWEAFVDALAGPGTATPFPGATPADDARTAAVARAAAGAGRLEPARQFAATHRSAFMRPWATPPHSIAHGILDDETYDWLELCSGMCETGGWPLVVSEDALRAAHDLVHATTALRPSHTGTAGLAGLADLLRAGLVGPAENVALLCTGAEH